MPKQKSKPQPTLNHEPQACVYARAKSGLSQVDVAKLIGKSPQLVSDIENGRRSATPAVLRKLADIYNCPIVVLERKRWVA